MFLPGRRRRGGAAAAWLIMQQRGWTVEGSGENSEGQTQRQTDVKERKKKQSWAVRCTRLIQGERADMSLDGRMIEGERK